MPIQLVITNVGTVFSVIVTLFLGILVFARRPNQRSSPNLVFFVFCVTVAIWAVSYGLGINLHDPDQSRIAFMFNLATLPMAVSLAHLVLIISKRIEGQRKVIKILYTVAGLMVVFFISFPYQFMLPSQSKLYLPNFFSPGPLYSLQDLFFFGVVIYLLSHIVIAYHHADYNVKNRLKYFIISIIYAMATSLTAEFLLYDIPIDPLPVAFFSLYSIPMAYAILKYDAIDINLLAKRSLGYALGIVGVTILILFTGYANESVLYFEPNFPRWILPLVSATISVMVGIFVWRKVREVDMLKYRFVDVVTHKFRTPLTYIRWSLETLRNSKDEKERTHAVDAIASAHIRLSELTDALVGLSGSDTSQFVYAYSPESMQTLVGEVLSLAAERIREKNITVETHVPDTLHLVSVDHKKVQFVIQMAVENAIIYSPDGSHITIKAEEKGDFIILSVKDSGIGISPEDMSRLFSKFFRSSDAVHSHTEGLGIGLYLSRSITRHHGGDMWAESDGVGKGSTFFIKIPIVREAQFKAPLVPTPQIASA